MVIRRITQEGSAVALAAAAATKNCQGDEGTPTVGGERRSAGHVGGLDGVLVVRERGRDVRIALLLHLNRTGGRSSAFGLEMMAKTAQRQYQMEKDKCMYNVENIQGAVWVSFEDRVL